MTGLVIRQGDALFIKQKIPKKARFVEHAAIGIEGETGNTHILDEVSVFSTDTNYFVKVKSPRELNHPQHPSVIIPVGSYRVTKVGDMDVAEQLFTPTRTQRTAGNVRVIHSVRTTPPD